MVVLLLLCAAAFGYQIMAMGAALRQMYQKRRQFEYQPGVSILKPVRGLDPGFREAIQSHARQDYPEFEILFGVSDPEDPAIPEISRLKSEYPDVPIRFVHCQGEAPNLKVAILRELAKEARHPVLLVNDSDIRVPGDYLRRVTGPLEDPGIGIVTCLYRADSRHWPGRFEALGIATDFVPSVLVALLTGISEFALGSTLVFRDRDLVKIGGFDAIADYLADDYQLGKRITSLGGRVYLSEVVVETSLGGESWSDVWRHQVRWHRTIRVSKGWGYLGLPFTFATFWAVMATLSGFGWLALASLTARMAAGLLAAWGVLRCPVSKRFWYWIPVRDIFGTVVWAAGLFGRTVEWRGRSLVLTSDGRIAEIARIPDDGRRSKRF